MTARNQSLDVLRGVAIIMVLCSHYETVIPQERSGLLDFAASGVDLFFVLSGFLISGLLFEEFQRTCTIDLKRFWIRRGFKIYPPFYALLLFTAVLSLVLHNGLPRELLFEGTFTQNYLPRFWPHTWSLAVEEHFYLFLPALVWVMALLAKGKQNPFRLIPLISITLSGLCLYLRIVALRHGAVWSQIAFPTHLRIDALFAGVSLGYFFYFDQESFLEAKRWWVLAIGLTFATTLLILPDVPRLTFAYVAFSFIVAWFATKPSRGPIAGRIAAVGRYSYSIYLWHGIAIMELTALPPRWFRFPVYFASAITLGVLMAKVIEIPALALRDRLFPSKTREGFAAKSPNESRVRQIEVPCAEAVSPP